MRPPTPPTPLAPAAGAAAPDTTQDDGDLAAALKARGRTVRVFDVTGILGLGGKVVRRIAMQIIPNGEETESILHAHATLAEFAKRAGRGAEAAAKDADIFANEKNIEALFRICRRVDKAGQATRTAAFPGPTWMRDELSTDEIAALLNLYDELKRKYGGTSLEINDEMVETLARVLHEHLADDIPEAVLAPYPRWFLTHLATMLAAKLADARKSVDVLLEDAKAATAEREALEAELASVRAERDALLADREATWAASAPAPANPTPTE
jgi:hypothetical protein